MDNEEIKKLLQELKESSDGSVSGRSKVVKIHLDTPQEAERRKRAKEKAEAKEARRLAQEAEKAKAEEEARQEARRLEAEKAAMEAVEEAKREAKAGFAADLEEQILSGSSQLSGEESGENGEEPGAGLDLNWEYEKPVLKSGFARDEDFDLGSGKRPEKKEKDSEETSESEDDFESDEGEFRSGPGEKPESITGLPGLFGSLTDRVLSFAGGVRRSVKEDLSRVREDRARKKGDSDDAGQEGGTDSSDGAGRENDSGRGPHTDQPEDEDQGFDPTGMTDLSRMPDDGRDETGESADQADQEEKAPAREYGPDEEWKRRMEEPPASKRKSRFRRLRSEKISLKGLPRREKKPKKKKEEASRTREAQDPSDEAVQEPDYPATLSERSVNDLIKGAASLSKGAGSTDEGADSLGRDAASLSKGAGSTDEDVDSLSRDAGSLSKGAGAMDEDADSLSRDAGSLSAAAGSPGESEAPEGEESVSEDADDFQREIEVIDLNENQNNKEAEVIPLVGSTGPLPDPAELKKEGSKRRFFEGRRKASPSRQGHAPNPGNSPDPEAPLKRKVRPKSGVPGKIGSFLAAHRRQLVIAVIAAAVAAAVAVGIWLIPGRLAGGRHALIEADDGLSVRVLKQPDSFTDQGDVQIRVKAPETIQSVTVNGENVVTEQGRTVTFTYHATGGTLNIMAVSTDKVRSAKVVLAYVDSQPPIVTIRKNGEGKIELNAEDSESGLDAIYIGNTNGLSDIPQYEKYSEPLEEDPEKEISYYAQDQAGNSTTPVVVALTPAESISFDRENYGLYPGVAQRVNLITTPENAFVNNLTLEAENAKVVQIEGDMQIRGMAEGDTKITATADGITGVMAGVSVSAQRKVRISAIGDCTLGTDINFSQNNSFDAYEALYGDSYFFEKVKGILSADDSTFANLEGTLTTSDQREYKTYAFKGSPSYTQILLDGSIDVVSLANNHSRDYGESSFTDTTQALESAGIEWCEGDHIGWRDLNGVRTAFIGIYSLENGVEKLPQLKSTIAEAKKAGADLIIVEFHWGAELVTEIDEYQKELAHTAVDEGANLVLGSHAHVLQGIEKYKGAYIVYGLGNFCFGGNSDPTSYDTMIWQQTFTLTADGLESSDDIAIIPCQVSGDLSSNNYQPVPVSGDAAGAIMQKIDELSAPFGQSYSRYMVDGTLWTESSQN